MAKQKWTPGPWSSVYGEATEDDQPHGYVVMHGDPATECQWKTDICYLFHSNERANASLISAAPDFADIAARAQWLANTRGGDYSALTHEELCTFMLEFDAALAKARGKS